MKIKKMMLFLVALLLSACASTPEAIRSEASNIQDVKQGQAAEKLAPSAEADAAANTQAKQQQELQAKSVYFDFDKFDIKTEYRDVIQQQADFIKAGEVSIVVEGNADERGSSEYNLALGSRRANAVAKAMVVVGVKSDQIKVVSFGEARPKMTCQEEKCWAENRRVDFNVKQGK